MSALAGQIETKIGGTTSPVIESLQVTGLLNPNPTPPSIDIYPANPFQAPIAFGQTPNNELFFTIRARVTTVDHEAGQLLLLSMMDPDSTASVATAVLADDTLGGQVEDVAISDGPSDYGVFTDPGGEGSYLGCTWTAQVTP